MTRFANPELLWLLLLIPLVIWRARGGRVATLRYAMTSPLAAIGRRARAHFGGWRALLRSLALALLIVALARPQVGFASQDVEASGVDLVLALDVSSSMQARDLSLHGARATRLDVVKDVVADFIEGRPSDRIGLLAFAGAPYLVSPLTLDHRWLEANLARVQLGMVEDGTAIGAAIAAGANRLRKTDAKSRVLVLLTDGVNTAGALSPTLAAESAAAEGVKVHTIAVGDASGAAAAAGDPAAHQIAPGAGVDEATLRQVAEITGGQFFRATDADSLSRVYAEIDRLEKTTRTVHRYERWHERFAWAAFPALLLLMLGLGLGYTRLRAVP